MKFLHAADYHLDSPILGRSPEQTQLLRQSLLQLPHKVSAAAREQGCKLMVLSGDLFDGPYTRESYLALVTSLEEAAMPVLIAPGNHDYYHPGSVWAQEKWPENVHIFRSEEMESVAFPELDCRVYGAAFTAPTAPALLEGFRAGGQERYAIGLLHGDPTSPSSPYCPVTPGQIAESALDYLALGHIHKRNSATCGGTLCAWPGCPMGRGFDETGEKGVLIVTLQPQRQIRFLPLDLPRFRRIDVDAAGDALQALAQALPAAESTDFIRVTLTGESAPLDTEAILQHFAHLPNLQLRERTMPPIDLWASASQDTLEGAYFRALLEAMEGQPEDVCNNIRLAAKISRRILDGQEVPLP